MPVVVQYGGDGSRYPLHRAACQGDDQGLEFLLAALKSQTLITGDELVGNTGPVGTAQLALESALEPEMDAAQNEASTQQLSAARQVLLTEEHLQGTDVEGCTPLHYSCYMGAARCCALLLHAKAEVNTKDAIDAGTALHFAAWKGDWPDIIQMLLDAGANRKLRNNYHKTPLEYAKDNKRTQTMAILKGGKGKKGKQKVKPGNALAAPTVMGRLLAQGARGKQDRRLKAGFEEDADKTVTLHIGGGNSEGEKPPENDSAVLAPRNVERQGGMKALTADEQAEFQEDPTPGRSTVLLTKKQVHDIYTRTKQSGGKLDIDRVMMEGLVTTEAAQTERVPQPATLVESADIFADKQIVTQLVGGGPRLTGKAKSKVKPDVEPKLPDTEHRRISSHGSAKANPGEVTAVPSQPEPTAASADEARREKARRKKKLKKERDRAAAAATAAAAAAAAAAADAT